MSYTVYMDSTFIPDQNSTTVSIRGGLGASASAASILSGQLSTAASSTSKDNPDQNSPAAPCFLFLLFLVHQKLFCIVKTAS